ncbi:hypothetical protein B0J15DRAFT_458792 [Fusarium solani]|uniref:Uncharacterized protein n=1 Tax=Fusarium solani TaxID=169388 RepID=A0A9P9RBQ3_FUSSL|nr:uncharacterized protein B0J15DRAFT_458792 [Fusarium solani]KAH7273696.1 hypothetical protein B0J15DRAFT_458792 [Fusarium solani]
MCYWKTTQLWTLCGCTVSSLDPQPGTNCQCKSNITDQGTQKWVGTQISPSAEAAEVTVELTSHGRQRPAASPKEGREALNGAALARDSDDGGALQASMPPSGWTDPSPGPGAFVSLHVGTLEGLLYPRSCLATN